MPNQPIPVPTATERMEQYIVYLTTLGVDPQQQTHSVSFESNAIVEWMNTTAPYADEFRICFGVNNNRMTVIIWPYNNGEPALDELQQLIEPFNEGAGRP